MKKGLTIVVFLFSILLLMSGCSELIDILVEDDDDDDNDGYYLEEDHYEYDNDFYSPSWIEINVSQSRTLTEYDVDFIQFSANSYSEYEISFFSNEGLYPQMYLYNNAYEQISSGSGDIYWSSNSFSGNCVIEVRDNSGSSGHYQIVVIEYAESGGIPGDDYEYDNSISSAGTIEIGWDRQSRSLSEGDEDYIQFYARQGYTYIIETLPNGGEYMDTEIWLLDAYPDYGDLDYDDEGGEESFSRIEWTCYSENTYYIRVKGWSGATGFYDLQVTETLTNDGFEYDNSFNDANSIDLNNTQSRVLTENDVDYISFYAGMAGYDYTISITTSEGLTPSLTLYNSSYGYITNGDSTITFGILSSGTYFIKVESAYGETGSYEITVTESFPDDQYEPYDNDIYNPTYYYDNQPQDHTLTEGDVDWITFYANNPGFNYTISATATEGLTPSLTLYDTNQNYLYSENHSLTYNLPDSGSYYIRVVSAYGETGSYQISITESLPDDQYEPYDNDMSNATYYYDNVPQDHTLTEGDVDYIKYFVDMPGYDYTFDAFPTSDIITHLTLYDYNGNYLTEGNNSIYWMINVSNYVYIKVESYNYGEVGSYQFVVQN